MKITKSDRDKHWREQQAKMGFKLIQVKIPIKDTARLKAYARKLVAEHSAEHNVNIFNQEH
jgi:hypothetical protein